MTLTLTTVNGRITLPDNSNPISANVTFQLTNYTSDGDIILSEIVEADVSPTTGDFTIDLWPNADDPVKAYYKVSAVLVYGQGVTNTEVLGTCVVPDQSSVELDTILVSENLPTPDIATIKANEAAASAAAAAASASSIGSVSQSFETQALLLAETGLSDDEIVHQGAYRYIIKPAGTPNPHLTLVDGKTAFEVGPVFSTRDHIELTYLADGEKFQADGLDYMVDVAAMGADSATSDLGKDGVVPYGDFSPEHYGATGVGGDDTDAVKRMVANLEGNTRIFCKGVYGLTETIHVPVDRCTWDGVAGRSRFVALEGFVGSGDVITNTLFQFNRTNSASKIFFNNIKNITFDCARGEVYRVDCAVHVNWAHHFIFEQCTFYGAEALGALMTANADTGETWAMYNSFKDCDFTYCKSGAEFGRTGYGIVNASQMTNVRLGGDGRPSGSAGVKFSNTSYNNTLLACDIENFDIGISNTGGYSQRIIGTLCEQNNLDYDGAAVDSAVGLGAEMNIVSSLEGLTNIAGNGQIKHMFVDSEAPNIVVDGRFSTSLYQSTLGDVIGAAGGAGGKGVWNKTNSAVTYTQDRTPLLLNWRGETPYGWYTFTFRAKCSSSGSLFLKVTGGANTNHRYCEQKSGATDYIEFLEVNAHKFVGGIGRSGSLGDEYRIYSGSIFFDGSAIPTIQIATQGSAVNFSIDWIGCFPGTVGHKPDDNRVFEAVNDVSALTAGQSQLIVSLPEPTDVSCKLTSFMTNPERAINELPYRVRHGTVNSKVYHQNLDNFGGWAGGSGNSHDHIYAPNNSQLIFFARSSMAGANRLFTRLEFI